MHAGLIQNDGPRIGDDAEANVVVGAADGERAGAVLDDVTADVDRTGKRCIAGTVNRQCAAGHTLLSAELEVAAYGECVCRMVGPRLIGGNADTVQVDGDWPGAWIDCYAAGAERQPVGCRAGLQKRGSAAVEHQAERAAIAADGCR